MEGRDKCEDDGAALPTVHTGAPLGNATTTLTRARAAKTEKIIIIIIIIIIAILEVDERIL